MYAGTLSQLGDRKADLLPDGAKRCGGKLVHAVDVNAFLHLGKPLSCSYAYDRPGFKQINMQERQRIYAQWMADVMERHGLHAKQWAELARAAAAAAGQSCQINGTTITRAMKDDFQYVTKATTLAQLAAAVGELPPTESDPVGDQAIPVPTKEALRVMIETHYRDTTGRSASDQMLDDLSARLHDSLASLQEDPDAARVPEAARTTAIHVNRRHAR